MDLVDDETSKLPPSLHLPHELIVSEILIRLPVKSLLRFRCACKAWRDTISGDTSFAQAHVRRYQPQKRRPSSLLIAPYIRTSVDHDDGDLMVGHAPPGLYLWEEECQRRQQDGVATPTLVHDMAWFPLVDWSKTGQGFAHCDGLLMLPDAEGTVRVLNPATRRSLTLPWSPNSTAARRRLFENENAFGFGRVGSPGSGVYKVARFFHRDPYSDTTVSMGMEVFTVGDQDTCCWRETTAKPPKYPFKAGRTATFFKGSLIWMIDFNSHVYRQRYGAHLVSCFVRFSLEDESFSVMAAPRWYPGPYYDYEEYSLAELDGELALTRHNKESIDIWMCDDVSPPRWARRHVINFPSCIYPITTYNDGVVFRDISHRLYRQTSEGSKHMVDMTTLKYLNPDTDTLVECSSMTFHSFDVVPYIPSLVPI